MRWVWGEEEQGGVAGWKALIRGVGEVGEAWEGFDDEVEEEEEEINDEKQDYDVVDGDDRGK